MRRLYTGEKLTPHQFCNDWITVKEHPGKVVSPLAVVLDPEDFEFFRSGQNPGTFWHAYELLDNGRFHLRYGGPRGRRNARREDS